MGFYALTISHLILALKSLPLAVIVLGFQELLIILIIALLFFGASRLPGLAKSLGQSVSSFKEGLDEGDSNSTSQNETVHQTKVEERKSLEDEG